MYQKEAAEVMIPLSHPHKIIYKGSFKIAT